MSAFHIGNHRAGDGTRDFDGYIDDVAVFHGVLDADGVAGLYSGALTPETVTVLDEICRRPPPVDEPAAFVPGSLDHGRPARHPAVLLHRQCPHLQPDDPVDRRQQGQPETSSWS